MNYLLYVIAAYTVTFIIIGIMFSCSYRKYKKARQLFNDFQGGLKK